MSCKDYKAIAEILGNGFAAFQDDRDLFYNAVYLPFVTMLTLDNSAFDQSRFSYAVAIAEGKALDNA